MNYIQSKQIRNKMSGSINNLHQIIRKHHKNRRTQTEKYNKRSDQIYVMSLEKMNVLIIENTGDHKNM